jgi:alkylation response protein AidB-like acyl-CoA dehydrogenase
MAVSTLDGSRSGALLDVVRDVGTEIWAYRDEIERDRRLPSALVNTLVRADMFKLLVPLALGGLEVDILTALRVFEQLAMVDGSAGWAVMIGNSGLFTAWLELEAGREMIGTEPGAPMGGVLAPSGRAIGVQAGYRVTGRWSFASGCEYSTWLLGACQVFESDAARIGPSGEPELRLLFFPRADCEILDTWSVGGLRGTGSHDFQVHEVFVPQRRSFSSADPPIHTGPLYRLPFLGLLASMLPAVALGIARGAIETLTELATNKIPAASRSLLRDRAMVQVQVAQAEAIVRSGRALLFETVSDAWAEVVAGRPLSLQQHALLRLAATHSAMCATQAVDLMYQAGGGTSVYTSSRLERAFRDVHVATQHLAIATTVYEPVGRVLLGLAPGTPAF